MIAIAAIVSGFAYLMATLLHEPKIEHASYNSKEDIMTVTYSNKKEVQYIKAYGDWNNFPMMTFVGRTKDNELDNIYYYIQKWGNDYPTAHLKQLEK
jgi:hypothetical protein